jgi:hypothetical protein
VIGLDQVATVWTRGVGGGHTVLVKSGLRCRLSAVAVEGSAAERAELSASRRLLWGPEYQLPEGCQVEVEGERWTAVRGTQARMRGPTGAVVYQRCEMVRAE